MHFCLFYGLARPIHDSNIYLCDITMKYAAKMLPKKVAIDHSTGRSIKMEGRTQRVQTWTQNLPDTQKEAKRERERERARGHKEAIFALP